MAVAAVMLGAGTWFVAFTIPTLVVGGFVASRKRLAYQWREELIDPTGGVYPPLTEAEMEFFCRVSPPHGSEKKGESLCTRENIGLHVSPEVISREEGQVLLDEVVRWVSMFGQKIDSRKVETVRQRAESDNLDLSFYSDVSIISDHAEDIQMMKAPWGTGDRIRHEMMPAALRYMTDRMQQTFKGVSRLRHVYVEYSPSGMFYHEPQVTKGFDGHDYVIIPLRRDQNATVVTFSPLLRSKVSALKEVVAGSWTSRDIDAIIPHGGALRVYGGARYEWGWCMRPRSVWFGHRDNCVRTLSAASAAPRGIMADVKRRLLNNREKPPKNQEAALVVLHFEGPRDSNKTRSLLFHPETLIFGRPPTPETFERWVECRPTEGSVREEGVFLFMVKNYLEMLRVS